MSDSIAPLEHNRIGVWIRMGWDLVTQDLPNYLVAGLLYAALIFALGVKTFGLASFLVLGPLGIGIYRVILEKTRTGETRLALLGEGFTAQHFPQALVASLVVAVFTSMGAALCLVPGFFVWTIYSFSFPLIAERSMTFWAAMEESRRRVTPHIWTLALFQLALLGTNLLGVLACGIGLAFTLPLTMAANVFAYREIMAGGLEEPVSDHGHQGVVGTGEPKGETEK